MSDPSLRLTPHFDKAERFTGDPDLACDAIDALYETSVGRDLYENEYSEFIMVDLVAGAFVVIYKPSLPNPNLIFYVEENFSPL